MVSLSNHVAISSPATPQNPVHPVHRCKNPSLPPLPRWERVGVRVKFAAHLPLREAQPLMVSLSNHAAISSPATPKIPFILSIDVKTRPFPLSLDGRGLG